MAKAVVDVSEDYEFSDIFYIDRDKKVGINWDEPPARLAISGSVSEALLNVQNLLYVTGSTALPRISIGKSTSDHALDVSGSARIYGATTITGSAIGTAILTVQTKALVVSGSAATPRVGIGQLTPNVALDVLGSAMISGSLAQSGSMTFNEGGVTITGSGVGTKMLNVNNIFVVSGSTLNPRIGVGKTSSAYALDVTGSAQVYGPLFISGSAGEYNFNYNNIVTMSGSGPSSGRLGVNVGLTDGIDAELQVVGDTFLNGDFNQNNLIYMTGSLAGVPRVSIGKTTSDYPLDVLGDVYLSGSTTNYGPVVITGSNVGASVLNVNNIFVVTGSTVFPMIGIGKTGPQVTLDVAGATAILGASTLSGSLLQSGSSTFNEGGMTVTGSVVSTKMLNVNDIFVVSGSTAFPRVGIGKTSSAHALDVTGSTNLYGVVTVTGSDIGTETFNVNNIFRVSGSLDYPRIGVGKASSAYSLDVTGSSYFYGPLTLTGSDITAPILNVSSKIFTVSGSETTPMIGIGTALPTNTLDIVGSSVRLRTGLGAQSGSAGQAGEIRWSGSIITGSAPAALYLCLATGTWAVFSGSIMNTTYGLIPS